MKINVSFSEDTTRIGAKFGEVHEIGASTYYRTTREASWGKADLDENGNLHAKYVYDLYDALMEKYPDNVQKLVWNDETASWSTEWEDYQPAEGTFVNWQYVISTRGYTDRLGNDGAYVSIYGNNPPINKPKYLILSGIHGKERKTVFSTYRFIRDLLRGHNIPTAFREGAIISVMPVGTPYSFDEFTKGNEKGVNINRNFGADTPEKETQAIQKWLYDNSDADLFIDFHNNGALYEKVMIVGLPDNTISNTARKIALRGVDHVIPFWRDVIGYHDKVESLGWDGTSETIEERNIIYSYTATINEDGLAIKYAQNVVGIPSIALETASFYGTHTEWVDGTWVDGKLVEGTNAKKADSPEAVAMGAEALGNILIEFYEDEVKNMADIDNKLDLLLRGTSFRIESGVMVVDEDMLPANGASSFTLKIPCSNGAKEVAFYADDATMAKIKETSDTMYLATYLGNFFATKVGQIATTSARRSFFTQMKNVEGYGWIVQDAATSNDNNTDGVTLPCRALKKGTYHWTAYYWDE